ncbi:MAG: hypothetical protein KZQ76_02705 [Candidatus Thiodiazotropha sp. (ex Epidulcina cf. delphinae)]|nr:hypothetical protein [Candidatus Thiodiazotropha sp. (ex Epidulcina cf. delphinae)]
MPKLEFTFLEYYRQNTHLLRAGLLQRIDELSVSDYPTTTPNQIICFLQDFLARLDEVIGKAGSEDKLKMLNSLIRELGIFLEWLDNAHTEQTPRGLVQLLKDLIDQMTPDSRVIARPLAQYNYTIFDLGQLLKKLVDDFIPHSQQAGFQEYITSPIKLISFPRIERDNMLAHAIFGHELGHPIADEYLKKEGNDTAHKATHAVIQKQVAELVSQTLSGSNADDAQKLALTTQVFNIILQVRKRALEELISDVVGILIFGPSAFFACHAMFWNGNLDAKPRNDTWYPPPRMRLRLMLHLMDELDIPMKFSQIAGEQDISLYVAIVNEFLEESRKLVDIKNDQTAINSDPQLKIAYDWMNLSLENAIEYAKSSVSAVIFQSEMIFSQLPGLMRRLELGVPPNEVGDPQNPQTVDYRASLLVAWMFKLRGVNPDTGEVLSNDEVNRLYKKALTAIEYVILQNKYTSDLLQEPKAGDSA